MKGKYWLMGLAALSAMGLKGYVNYKGYVDDTVTNIYDTYRHKEFTDFGELDTLDNWAIVKPGDFDGDGDLDAIVFSGDGTIILYENKMRQCPQLERSPWQMPQPKMPYDKI